jgi:ABC-2 type transport system ATP-binding protein
MPSIAIETQSLTKIYKGRADAAIKGLDLKVEEGEFFDFLGPNGAGKSTTVRLLMTLLRPTSGRAFVQGFDVLAEPLNAMKSVGFVPEHPGSYPNSTGYQNLAYWAQLFGMAKSSASARIIDLLGQVGLREVSHKPAGSYSLGMKRRLALAGALLPNPEIMILDEPSLGLDPEGMAFVRSLLESIHREGRTIFLSSHLLGEVEKLCTRVGVLNRGKLIRVDTPTAIRKSAAKPVTVLEIVTAGIDPRVATAVQGIRGVIEVNVQGNRLIVSGELSDEIVAEINKVLIELGVAIFSSTRQAVSLEDAFLSLIEKDV